MAALNLFLKMEWSSKEVIRLIGAYRDRPELWDYNDSNYKVISRKNEAWSEIANMFGTDALEVRRKMNSVLASFRRERKKVEMAKQGAGVHDEVCSSWFGYEHLLFLIDKFKARGTREMDWIADPKDCDTSAEEDTTAEMLITNVKSEVSDMTDNYQEEELVTQMVSPRRKPTVKRRLTPDYLRSEMGFEAKRPATADRDESDIFGELIASQLRNLDHRTRCIAQHSISNVIFQAQMGLLEAPVQHGVRGEQNLRDARDDRMPWQHAETWSSERHPRISRPRDPNFQMEIAAENEAVIQARDC